MIETRPSRNTIVIPVFHSDENLERCISALQSMLGPELDIIVVDHSINHQASETLTRPHEHVSILKKGAELWWAGAVNAGIVAALDRGAEGVILLNDDCIFEPGALANLLTHAGKHPDAIIAATQCQISDQRCLVKASDCMLLGFPTVARLVPRKSLEQFDKLSTTRLIVGGRGAIVPRSVFDSVGLLDATNFPHYGADHDFYWRCRRAGVGLRVATDAIVMVDDRRSTLGDIARLNNWKDFRQSLTDRRSHRNLKMLRALFRKHYPIRPLYFVGIALLTLRYALFFVLRRRR
jgi:GT2 family glycosyltransferase